MFEPYLCKAALTVIPSGRCLAITAALTTLTVGSIFAQDYDEMDVVAPDASFNVPTPSIDEYINIGGFQLRVDQTKWGIDLTPNNHGLLGRLRGRNVNIDVIEIPRAHSLNPLVANRAPTTGSSVHVEPRASGYKSNNISWLRSMGSKGLKSFSVSSSWIGTFSKG